MEKEKIKDFVRMGLSAVFLLLGFILQEGTLRISSFVLSAVASGYPVLLETLDNIRHFDFFDENFLMTLAAVTAFAIGEYPEGAAVLFLFGIGELLEDYAVDKSRDAINSLLDIRPDRATVQRDGNEVTVASDDVAVGETVVIRPGERIPVDGYITEGSTSINQSALTGESAPVYAGVGDSVSSGCVNISGVISVRVLAAANESAAARTLRLLEEASEKKSPSERFITRFSKIYTPAVVVGALLIACIPPLLFGGEWGEFIRRGLVFLVVSCPCALVISVPLTFFAGISGASKHGILIKGGAALEKLSKVKTAVFDKTGTLTKGNFEVTAVHPDLIDGDGLLELAALAESISNHPISESLISACKTVPDKSRVKNAKEIAGKGIEAEIDGRKVVVGNGKLMDLMDVEYRNCHRPGTVVHVAADGKYLGHIVISDGLKPDTKEALKKLRLMGVERVIMLTGDSEATAKSVADELEINDVRAELLPDGKLSELDGIMTEKHNGSVIFTGDGINDAPVLMRSDVGVSMGGIGSDAAVQASDIVIMNDSIGKISEAVGISRNTMRIVRQNIGVSISVKILVLLCGLIGIAPIWLAVFADVGVTLIAVLNSARAMNLR